MLKKLFQIIAITGILLLAACSSGGEYESSVQEDTTIENPADEADEEPDTKDEEQSVMEEDGQSSSSEDGEIIIGEEEQLILNGVVLTKQAVAGEERIVWELDVNLDGIREEIIVERLDTGKDSLQYNIWRNYRIQVGESSLEDYGDDVAPELIVISPDGEVILLAIFDYGPSGDPTTWFYRYDGEALLNVGWMSADIRTVDMSSDEKMYNDGVYREADGTFKATFRGDVIQTQWAWGYWYWNGEVMAMREDAEYEYVIYGDEHDWITLLEPLEVYETMDEDVSPILMNPQQVQCTRTDGEEWVYLEGEDGTKGWLRLQNGRIPPLGREYPWKFPEEVFDGRNTAG